MPPSPRNGTRPVRLAAAELRQALTLPEAERAGRVREAKEWLLSAADNQGRESAVAREQYFAAPPSTEARTVSTAQALAGIIADAQVGNTLIAAGQALGEAGVQTGPGVLDDAILALESTPDFAGQIEPALHFSAPPTRSATLEDAAKTFQSRVQDTLNTLVTQSREAGGTVVDKLLKLDGAKALEALAQLGGPLASLPDAGVFIKKGLEKLKQAMHSLRDLLDADGLQQVKQKLTDAWKHLTDGTFMDLLLAWAFDESRIDDTVRKALAQTSLSSSTVDGASDLLLPLQDGYKTRMAWTKALSGIIAGGAGLLLLSGPFGAGPVVIVAAGAYLLILVAILLMGRDYAGEKGLFHEGRGILGIAESLL
jgi:hypothetical protein